MMIKTKHNFHMVDYSPWPIMTSFMVMLLALSLITWFKWNSTKTIYTSITLLTISSMLWWRDVNRESNMQGLHTNKVLMNMKMGMMMFITSEVLFFFSFFWAFFHSSLSPTMEIGLMWPPMMISPFNPLEIPLLNTIILLSSGITVTWSHHSIINNHKYSSLGSLTMTIFLGIIFTLLQGIEYNQSSFTIADSIYGTCFFLSTGFHGMHVMVGTIFLSIMLLRLTMYQVSNQHHFGFEAAAWYWHFVDVVWLFLYINVYWWGM